MTNNGPEIDIDAIARRLTINGAITLHHSFRDLRKGEQPQVGRVFTGNGKWTTLAAIGVENSLISLGLTEMQKLYPDDPWDKTEILCWSRLGLEVGHYITTHWNELEFRWPKKRR